jgi:serine protease Do
LGRAKKVKLGIIRDGDKQSFDVTLGEQTDVKTTADKLHEGLTGAELTNTNASDSVQGIKVTSIEKGSSAEAYQLLQGDIIIGVNRQRVKNLAEFRKVVEGHSGVLALNIQRGERTLYLVIR